MSNQGRILVVDDSRMIVSIIEQALRKHGYQVFTAFDGQDGLQRAQELKPDLVILDVMMPGMDGYEVCRRVKTNPATAGSKVLMLTTRGSVDISLDPSRSRGFEAGADEFLTKPVQVKELVKQIETLLQARD
jgi:DNA-binding response OmpR family regulator